MKFSLVKSLVLCSATIALQVTAQQMPDIGFESVGRGRPLMESVQGAPIVGPARGFARGGAEAPLNGYYPDELPDGIEPLEVDVFTTTDFYADEALWSDPRYFRCNSPYATEAQRGILTPQPLSETVEGSPWGNCDIDLPREAIVSPYGFATAQEHYEALLAETEGRGGPGDYTFKDFPTEEWNGIYQRPAGSSNQQSWYWLQHNQVSTALSLLTPEYQKRMVQEVYHQVHGHALWQSSFCWPEGFMRRYYPFAVWEHQIIATPDMVQISAGVADNFITNIHVGREFNMEDIPNGGVPRLGEAVPRWYGETVGFWDGDILITWTSNIQGWKAHSAFEFSSQMQTIEIYTPNRDADGNFLGLNHESILYDPESFVEPVRIVRNMNKVNEFTDPDLQPIVFIECFQNIFPVDGNAVPIPAGTVIEYEVPDMYGPPWDKIWRDAFEQDMSGSGDDLEDLFNFE